MSNTYFIVVNEDHQDYAIENIANIEEAGNAMDKYRAKGQRLGEKVIEAASLQEAETIASHFYPHYHYVDLDSALSLPAR